MGRKPEADKEEGRLREEKKKADKEEKKAAQTPAAEGSRSAQGAGSLATP